MSARRIVVTGGRGFIGSTLVKRLISQGHEVLNIDLGTYAAVPGALDDVASNDRYRLTEGSISDRTLVEEALRNFEPTIVLNLAAESHVDRSIDRPMPFVDTNVVGAVTLLEAVTEYWRRLSDPRQEEFSFIQVSTDEVFGSIEIGLAESNTRYEPSSPYAATKAASDHLTRAWRRTYGLPTIVTNCSNNYGPYQFPEKLIPLVIVRALTDRSVPVYGDGGHVRDWIHVDDHCRGLELVSFNGVPGTTYLIGARTVRTNRQVVDAVCSNLDEITPREDGRPHASAIEQVVDRPGHDRRYAINPTTSEELGFRPEVPFEQGLRKTVLWYVENRGWWESVLAERYGTDRIGLVR